MFVKVFCNFLQQKMLKIDYSRTEKWNFRNEKQRFLHSHPTASLEKVFSGNWAILKIKQHSGWDSACIRAEPERIHSSPIDAEWLRFWLSGASYKMVQVFYSGYLVLLIKWFRFSLWLSGDSCQMVQVFTLVVGYLLKIVQVFPLVI